MDFNLYVEEIIDEKLCFRKRAAILLSVVNESYFSQCNFMEIHCLQPKRLAAILASVIFHRNAGALVRSKYPQSAEFLVTDAEWSIIEPMLLKGSEKRGRRPANPRLTVSAILWLFQNNAHWRNIPEYYGRWETVYRQFNSWKIRGLWGDLEIIINTKNDNGQFNRLSDISEKIKNYLDGSHAVYSENEMHHSNISSHKSKKFQNISHWTIRRFTFNISGVDEISSTKIRHSKKFSYPTVDNDLVICLSIEKFFTDAI